MKVRCVITGQDGTEIISEEAGLTVPKEVTIKEQPKNQNVKLGDRVTYSIAAEGAKRYQWQYKKTTSSSWVNWSNGNGTSVSGIVSEGWDGMKVRCVITGQDGTEIISDEAMLYVIKSEEWELPIQ